MPLTIKTLTVTAETPAEVRRADRAVQSLTGLSRRQTQALFDNRCVMLNGELCQAPWQPLLDSMTVEVAYEPDRHYKQAKRPPRYLGFDILFEDEHLIVVNKPANWLTVPSAKREQNTLVHRVSEYLTKKHRGRRAFVYPAHRLDRGVSGVLLLGKNQEIATLLRKQFEEHKPERHYVAIVAGRVADARGTIRSFLSTDARLTRHSADDEESGELAITHFAVERHLADTTLVRIWLETGRRHQIRVHLAEAGHPVLGDPRYGGGKSKHEAWRCNRLALHATRLVVGHPTTLATQQFETAIPFVIQQFLERKISE